MQAALALRQSSSCRGLLVFPSVREETPTHRASSFFYPHSASHWPGLHIPIALPPGIIVSSRHF